MTSELTRCVNDDCPMQRKCGRFLHHEDIKIGVKYNFEEFQFETIDTDTLPIALTGLMEACGYQNLRAAKCDHYIEKGD